MIGTDGHQWQFNRLSVDSHHIFVMQR